MFREIAEEPKVVRVLFATMCIVGTIVLTMMFCIVALAAVEFTDKEIAHFKAEFSIKELRDARDLIISDRDVLLAEEDAKNQISKQTIMNAYEVLIDAKEDEIGNVGIGITVPIQ